MTTVRTSSCFVNTKASDPGERPPPFDAQDGLVAVEELVGLVPVLLRTLAEEVDVADVHGARHRAQFVVDVLAVRRHLTYAI